MPTTVPCLWFDGRAEEAATFYTGIFPRSSIDAVSRCGPGMPFPEGTAMVVEFTLDGQPYSALNGGPPFPFTQAVAYRIDCADQDEVDHFWDGLTDGGEELALGWLRDRFGVSWQVVPTALVTLLTDLDPGRVARASQAMVGMTRIDIAAIQRASDGVGE